MTKKQIVHIPNKFKDILYKIEELKPYEGNPNTHTKRSIDELKKAILDIGFMNPITVTADMKVVAGHGRIKAMVELGREEIPCDVIHMTDSEYYKHMLSDNKIATLSREDKERARQAMEMIESLDEAESFTIPAGYTDEDIDKMFGRITKEVLDTKADFGDAGEVEIDDDARVTSMTLKMTVTQHKKVKSVMGAIMRENNLETTGECMVLMANKFSGPAKTIRRTP